MVLDMLAYNNWERPIYFAITVGSDNFMGLEKYFQLEGLSYRLVPYKAVSPDGQTGEVNVDKMYDNLINKFYTVLKGKIPIIGVGGVDSGKSAYEKILAGASLLQLYTGFVYRGPSTAKDIKKELIHILKTEGIKNIKDAIGQSV